MKSIFREKRILLWVFFVALSVVLISPDPNPRGIRVVSAGPDISGKVLAGEIIYKINDQDATLEKLQQQYFDIVRLETNKGVKFFRANGSLEISAEKVSGTNLKFGLDIRGGITATIKPEKADPETLQQIISTLRTRINTYGLRETVFRPVYYGGQGFVDISIAGGDESELKNLIESQGKFEAKMQLLIRLNRGAGRLQLDRNYAIGAFNGTVLVDNKTVNKSFVLGGIEFYADDIRDDAINLTATVFTGNDVKIVFFDPQHSSVQPAGNIYQWSFQVQITNEAADRFYWIARNMQTYIDPGSGERYLESQISFYLDERLIDSLNVAGSFRDAPVASPSVSGSAPTQQEAIAQKSKLQSILRSGKLPTKIEIVQLSSISPTLGADFIKNAMLAALGAAIGVAAVVYLRYRRLKIVLPMLMISLSEVIIILGFASRLWTIDVAAIGGIIAAVGTGIDSQIVIIDNALRKESQGSTLKERLKRAFFIIFGAAGTVIAAMLPLTAISALSGFAITTMIGVLVGVLIARPAFGAIAEKIIHE